MEEKIETEIKDIENKNSENGIQDSNNQTQKLSKKQEFFQFLKFLAFPLSAGAIQLLSFELMYNIINWKSWWATYLISVVLSVIWNFTFNRKFTFKSASNVTVSMILALLFYVPFIPLSVFGGNALEQIGWNGTLVTLMMMVINFIGEFAWDKLVVFNDKIVGKIAKIIPQKTKTNNK